MMWRRRETARPLSEDEVRELRDEGLEELIVQLDGATYSSEDLYSCAGGCDDLFADPSELDDEDFCEECAREAREEAEHQRQLRADYRASVL
ncbi:hypothetical protein ELZ19_06995 [Brucella abortus]|uniref:hypothetical protein n=1 Tax=Brucella abortus TaxID=235 RepID=UPI0004E88C82|nr:hypothetical protein [Brucella abortus]KFH18450.1 hypothetical protein IB60_17245 [Brucella abortus LMN1]RUQ67317.1 hypothetical protein ELZ23_15425 [Brucella abortus]RUQ78552.1 hypothetical protein ELZ22_16900 [Brucella abortus]RUQ88294.1 hypothetical protein ELZ18_15655 [Brucella abortus]RUQ90324.1 hypothetical protein ELZ20_15655 [Brucella abortus]